MSRGCERGESVGQTAGRLPAGRSRTRVLIIEDHALFAESLELALTMSGYDVIWRAPEKTTTPSALLSWILRQRPRIVLLDLDLDLGGLGDGDLLVTPLARHGIDVVVVAGSRQQVQWGESLSSGARIVLPKTSPLEDILGVVHRIADGRSVMDAAERERLIQTWRHEDNAKRDLRARLQTLTPREQQILGRLMLGRSVREIAERSMVSEATVRTQVKSILATLQTSSQLAAVGLAHSVGWRAHSAVADPTGQRGAPPAEMRRA